MKWLTIVAGLLFLASSAFALDIGTIGEGMRKAYGPGGLRDQREDRALRREMIRHDLERRRFELEEAKRASARRRMLDKRNDAEYEAGARRRSTLGSGVRR